MVNVSEAPHDLAEAIESRIHSRTHGRVRDLRVELADRSVVIRGRAKSYYTKQLALHGALDAVDQGMVINEIVVG